jgi:transcriptional regulator with XRE-family HTH domain
MANILSDNNFILEDFNPDAIMKKIAARVKQNRLELKLSQSALSAQSGVSLGSLKRFEHNGEISFKNLVMLAIALDSTEEFGLLFSKQKYQSIAELLDKIKVKTVKRGRRNVF